MEMTDEEVQKSLAKKVAEARRQIAEEDKQGLSIRAITIKCGLPLTREENVYGKLDN